MTYVRPLIVSALAFLASLAHAGEINIYFKDLNGILSLTTEQGGVEVGTPFCNQATKTCSMFLDQQFSDDFPAQTLIAGIEQLYSQHQGLFPAVFTALVKYDAINYEGEMGVDNCNDEEPLDCADIDIHFYGSPFDVLLDTPIMQQPPADGIEHELSTYFEDHSLNTNFVVGLPPAAIHIFVTADGAAVPTPEPSTLSLLALPALFLAARCMRSQH